MENPIIQIGEYEVVSNGTIITHDNKDIIFRFDELTFVISFCNDENEKEGIIKAEAPEGGKSLVIKLINFNESLGRGLIDPAEVGIVNGKQLLLHFYVTSLNTKSTKVFQYSWLTKEIGGKGDGNG